MHLSLRSRERTVSYLRVREFILTIIKKVNIRVGITDLYFSAVIVGMAIANMSWFLTALIVRELTKNRHYTLLAYVVSFLYIGLSPWCIIPYTDIYAVFIVCIVIAKGSVYSAENYMGVVLDDERSFSDRVSGREGNYSVILERIEEKGFTGMIVFELKKLLMNYNNGSFAWASEGEFYKDFSDRLNTFSSQYLRQFYFSENNALIFNVMQTFWMVILCLDVMAGWLFRYRRKDIITIFLTLTGITIFTLLFEGRARYLFLYSPYYVIAAIMGIKFLSEYGKEKYKNKAFLKDMKIV